MSRRFNTTGCCSPKRHYMVDLSSRLEEIKAMVDAGEYFMINRARQYGKTTILLALGEYLKEDYEVISLDFQGLSYEDFQSEQRFTAAFSRQLLLCKRNIAQDIKEELQQLGKGNDENATLSVLLMILQRLCCASDKAVVLIIDEVDAASNNQVFIDFLAQLRFYYLKRNAFQTFQSVILAGVYDIRDIKRKIRPDEEHKVNSPWNIREGNEESASLLAFDDCPRGKKAITPFDIAADFNVDMSFSTENISGMLAQYEADYRTGMDIGKIAGLIYNYTSGYPFLVSRLCKLMDERLSGTARFPDKAAAWTEEGFLAAVKIMLEENNTLFDSLMNKLEQFPELQELISRLLFQGQSIPYVPDDAAVRDAMMFGFIKVVDSRVLIANRIFETRLYNRFLLDYDAQNKEIFAQGARQKNQFIIDGHLNMKRVLEKFVETFDSLYGEKDETFLEEEGRRYFMLFLKPIINGTGNCYVEAETRNHERMDLVVDYCGEQFIIELKIWRGNAYNERGEEQLSAYLEYFHLQKGYMLSFNFNHKKQIGVKEIIVGDKAIIEAVV